MSRRATELGAVNVGQGFPDYPIDPDLAACVTEAVAAGLQPVRAHGRQRRAARRHRGQDRRGRRPRGRPRDRAHRQLRRHRIYLLRHPGRGRRTGDEAIVFDPAYDAYDPAIRLAGGRCIHIPLRAPAFPLRLGSRARAALSERTRLIIINNPHNPACTVASAADLDALARLSDRRDRPITVLADEVYEHVLYDGRVHQSVMNHPELRERSFAVYSFGKTLHITGWRVGYCVAPPDADARAAQGAPVQHLQHRRAAAGGHPPVPAAPPGCLARASPRSSAPSATCCARSWPAAGSTLPPAQGSYFQLADYGAARRLAALDDVRIHREADQRGRRRGDPAVAVLPRAAGRHAHRAAVRRQARRDAGRGRGAHQRVHRRGRGRRA